MKRSREQHREYMREYYAKKEPPDARARRLARCLKNAREYHAARRNEPEFCLRRLVSAAKQRAKKKGLEFNLNWRTMRIPAVCPLLGIPLECGGGLSNRDSSPSLDRIDSTRGYTTDNVWIISHRANTIKNNATLAELKLITQNLEARMLWDGK